MKKKYVAALLGLMMACSLTVSGCGSASSSSSSSSTIDESISTEAETIYGQITSVGDSSITLTLGEYDEESGTFTAGTETKEISVTDDTEYTMGDMGMGQGGDGQAPSGDGSGSDSQTTPPEMPDGSDQNGSDGSTQSGSSSDSQTTPPDKPDGEDQASSGNGQAPSDNGQAPSGGSGSDSQTTPPDKPDGEDQASSGNGQAPSGGSGSDSQTTPPDKPDGEGQAPSGDDSASASDSSADTQDNISSDSSAPAMPDGDGQAPSGDGAGQPGNMGGDMTLSLDTLSEGTTVAVTLAGDGSAETITLLGGMGQPGGMGGDMGGGSAGVDSYVSVNEYNSDTDLSGETIESTGTDENAALIDNGANVTMSDMTIARTSTDSTGGDNSSFYGVGAAVLNTDGTLKISDSTITTDADGGAGVFSYGDGVTYVSDTKITTNADTSGGIHVAGGGTLYAWDLDVETNGESSAAIRSDRGSGTMVVDGGTYTSNGVGSPAIYSTADITVNDADLTANGSEAICIEGMNTVRLFDCNLTGNMSDNEQNDCTWNVILYQSMSGDSAEGNSTFEMVGGTLTAKNGGMFYTTNTESTFVLDDVDIKNAEDSDFFLKCTGNSNQRGWGSAGANGADCNFTAISQKMEGDILWDSISTLNLYMTDGSTLTGAILDDESNAGNGGDGSCTVNISKDSTWTVTADSTLTTLNNEGKIVDANGKTVSIVGTDGTTYVKGDSDLTITVTNYSTTADMSGASTADSFSDYETEQN